MEIEKIIEGIPSKTFEKAILNTIEQKILEDIYAEEGIVAKKVEKTLSKYIDSEEFKKCLFDTVNQICAEQEFKDWLREGFVEFVSEKLGLHKH